MLCFEPEMFTYVKCIAKCSREVLVSKRFSHWGCCMSAYWETSEAGAFLELVWTSISAYTSCMGGGNGGREEREREGGRERREGGSGRNIT